MSPGVVLASWKTGESSTYKGQNGFIFKLGIQAMDGEVLGFERLLSAGAKGTPNWGVELTKIFESPYLKAQTRY